MLRSIFLLLLTLFLVGQAGADPEKFRLVPMDIEIKDRFDRPYENDKEDVYLGVRLAQDEKQSNKRVADYTSLQLGSYEFPRVTQEYQKVLVKNGIAHVNFLTLTDDDAPVDYELKLIRGGDMFTLSPTVWPIGTQSQSQGEAKAEGLRAPHSSGEIAAMTGFGIIAFVLSYWLLGRALFARMLEGRGMEVGTAEAASNLLLVTFWGLAAVSIAGMVFFPYIFWQELFWIYVLVPVGYLLLLLVTYALGHLLTRA